MAISLQFRMIGHSPTCFGCEKETDANLVLNATDWLPFKKEHSKLPDVDFTKHKVVVLNVTLPSCAQEFFVQKVTQIGRQILVEGAPLDEEDCGLASLGEAIYFIEVDVADAVDTATLTIKPSVSIEEAASELAPLKAQVDDAECKYINLLYDRRLSYQQAYTVKPDKSELEQIKIRLDELKDQYSHQAHQIKVKLLGPLL